MHVEQIYTGCLAQGAYYIHSNGEAAIIDPLREVGPYLDRLAADGVKLKYIFETHFHADFVSGHVTLSEKTAAPIVYGPTAKTDYDSIKAVDGQIFKVGDITIKALHTPGHTMESTSYLLTDADGKDYCIFTGDTLFLGDVGRPDLCQKEADITEADLAGMLYDSLRTKIMNLSDDLLVYPAHGAGSACGKNMMKITVDTLGNQKAMNYALRADMTKEQFIKEVTDGLAAAPAYFPLNVKLNKEGYQDLAIILEKGLRPLSPTAFQLTVETHEALVLDVRSKDAYAMSHVPGSIFIGIDGSFAPWVGALIKDIKTPIVIVAPEEREQEAITRLSRVGFDNTLGYLEGGIAAWKEANLETDNVSQVTAEEFEALAKKQEVKLVDVRKSAEYNLGHLDIAQSVPLSELDLKMNGLPSETVFYEHCQSGYRSMIAASMMKARGYHNVVNIKGGYNALKQGAHAITEGVCPSTLK